MKCFEAIENLLRTSLLMDQQLVARYSGNLFKEMRESVKMEQKGEGI